MKTIQKNNSKTLNIERFAGVDTRSACTLSTGTADILNMVPLFDGSLKKRCGYDRFFSLPTKPRALWTGKINGKNMAFALCNTQLYSIDFSNNSMKFIAYSSTSSGDTGIFCYDGYIYFIDGSTFRLYDVTAEVFRSPQGYVPLVGKDWPDTLVGELYEPRNLLNNRARISYIVREKATNFFRTDAPLGSIDAVYVNGTQIDSSRYTIAPLAKTVSITDLSAGDRVEMYFTHISPADQQAMSKLLSCTSAEVFGGITNSRPFLWGGNDKTLIFSSKFVTKDQLKDSRKVYGGSDTLYFPVGCEFKAGDGRSPITAVSKHYDRLLIFTGEGAWMADSNSCGTDDVPALKINSSRGALAPKAATLLGNNPYTIDADGIIQWSSNTDELDECNAKNISEPIKELLPDDVFTNGIIFADKHQNRLFVTSPSLNGIVWVWYADPNAWVRFDLGMSVDQFFEAPGGVGFLNDQNMYVFNEDKYQDYGNREIIGRFKGNFTDFNKHGKKRIFGASVCCDGEITLDCSLDSDTTPAVSLTMSASGCESTRRRINARRFDTLCPTITARGNDRQIIHSLKLWAE